MLIFEGFDEMANVSDIESRLAHFRSLWKFSYPLSKLLFTGRRNLFFLEQEIELVFGGANRLATDPYCDILHLRQFDLQQIEKALRWSSEGVRQGIINAAQLNEQMLDIVSRPSLLFIVAWPWPELQRHADAGTNDFWQRVIGQGSSNTVIEGRLRRQPQAWIFTFLLEGEELSSLSHEGLAAFMATKGGVSNQITHQEFADAIEALYKEYPDDQHLLPPGIMESAARPLKIRLGWMPRRAVARFRTHSIRRSTFEFSAGSRWRWPPAAAAAVLRRRWSRWWCARCCRSSTRRRLARW